MFVQRFIYSICLIICCFTATSQKLKFDNYTSKDGLISNDVYNLHQDKKGYIWLFTNYGVMKYNGNKFELVLKNLPFNESFIYCIYENNNGNKWVVNSNAKIYEVINDSAFLVKGAEKVSDMIYKKALPIYQICVDDSLNIFLGSHRTSYKLIKNKDYSPIKLSNSENENSYIADVIEFKSGHLFSSFNQEPKTIRTELKKYLDLNFFGYNLKKNTIKIDYNSGFGPTHFKKYFNELYFSNQNLLFKIKNFNLYKKLNFKGFILNYTKDVNNHLWVGCYNDGLYELDENDSIVNHYFENKTVNDVLVDTQHGLWVSTEGFGLYHCENLNTLHYKNSALLGSSISLIKQIDDKLFIANSRGAVFLQETKIHNENLLIGEPLDVIKDKKWYLIAFRAGSEVLELQNKSIAKIVSKNDFIFHAYKLLKEENDTILYMGRKGINFRVKNKLTKMLRYNYKTYSIAKRNGIVLIATDHGVYQIINDKLVMPSYLLSTKNDIVTKIVIDNVNNYWFCTKGSGLFKLTNKNELKQYTVSNNLPSNIIYDISFNNDSSILLATNKGLFYSDGLNNDLKNWNQLYTEEVKSALMYNHIIYLATNNGLVTIKENTIHSNKPIYLNIKSILVNGLPKNQKKLKLLKYNENNLEFNFDIISYSTSIPKIKYELSGDKTEGGVKLTQQLNFHNLDAGNYKLTITLLSIENQGNPIVIEFTIIPAIWQTVWFKLLVIFGCLASCFFIGWKIFKYYKKKEDKKNEMNKLITEYKLIALKAQINPHFMSNCLTAIQQLIITHKLDQANQYLAKFSFLVRQVLNFSSKNVVTLKEELEIALLNIELEQLRFENKFETLIEVDNTIDTSAIFVPPLLLQPIIENAFWHGLLPLRDDRKGILKITIYSKSQSIYIIIEDNGVGRKKEKDTIVNLKDSKGIKIIKQRIESLNNYYNSNTGNLIFEDLKDELNNALGSRVTITLPVLNNSLYDDDKDFNN